MVLPEEARMLENGADRQGRGRLGEMIYKEQTSAIDVRKVLSFSVS